MLCKGCGKEIDVNDLLEIDEFIQLTPENKEKRIATRQCPACGMMHIKTGAAYHGTEDKELRRALDHLVKVDYVKNM
jgi:NMD protein affecting ribosome stability and mRNA decay